MYQISETGKSIHATQLIPKETIILKKENFLTHRLPLTKNQGTIDYKTILTMYTKQAKLLFNDADPRLSMLSYVIENLQNYPSNWLDQFLPNEIEIDISEDDKKIMKILFQKYPLSISIDNIIKIYKIMSFNCFEHTTFDEQFVYLVVNSIISKFGNSCSNNANIMFFPKHTVVIASKDIKGGEEITINLIKKLPYVKCDCSICFKKNIYDDFLKKTRIRDTTTNYDGTRVQINQFFDKYINFDVYGGIELFFHPIYESIHYKPHDGMAGAAVPSIQGHYLKQMCEKLSVFYGVEENEILAYFMFSSKQFYKSFIQGSIGMISGIKFDPEITFEFKKDIEYIRKQIVEENDRFYNNMDANQLMEFAFMMDRVINKDKKNKK